MLGYALTFACISNENTGTTSQRDFAVRESRPSLARPSVTEHQSVPNEYGGMLLDEMVPACLVSFCLRPFSPAQI